MAGSPESGAKYPAQNGGNRRSPQPVGLGGVLPSNFGTLYGNVGVGAPGGTVPAANGGNRRNLRTPWPANTIPTSYNSYYRKIK